MQLISHWLHALFPPVFICCTFQKPNVTWGGVKAWQGREYRSRVSFKGTRGPQVILSDEEWGTQCTVGIPKGSSPNLIKADPLLVFHHFLLTHGEWNISPFLGYFTSFWKRRMRVWKRRVESVKKTQKNGNRRGGKWVFPLLPFIFFKGVIKKFCTYSTFGKFRRERWQFSVGLKGGVGTAC